MARAKYQKLKTFSIQGISRLVAGAAVAEATCCLNKRAELFVFSSNFLVDIF